MRAVTPAGVGALFVGATVLAFATEQNAATNLGRMRHSMLNGIGARHSRDSVEPGYGDFIDDCVRTPLATALGLPRGHEEGLAGSV
jgi:hypothetical protein